MNKTDTKQDNAKSFLLAVTAVLMAKSLTDIQKLAAIKQLSENEA